MPRTADYFLDCAFYIYGSKEAALENSPREGGSGFLAAARVTAESPFHQYYAVTAAHVVYGAETPFIRVNKRFSNEVEVIEAPASSWVQHPNGDDVSVCPLNLQTAALRTLGIETTRFVTTDIIETEDIGIGDEVFMLGRFAQHSGSKTQNIPVARFGTIATMPIEPLLSEGGIKQESFLIECRSVPGHSGAPAFVYKRDRFEQSGEKNFLGQRVVKWDGAKQLMSASYWLLGIDWCHLHDPITKANTGMAGVIPAWKIMDIIHSGPLAQQRIEQAERMRKAGNLLDYPNAG
jgi:hypothetical protein